VLAIIGNMAYQADQGAPRRSHFSRIKPQVRYTGVPLRQSSSLISEGRMSSLGTTRTGEFKWPWKIVRRIESPLRLSHHITIW
jgi:hypothetical protein